jgi:hypothetical protein
MKIICTVLSIFLFCVSFYAQDKKESTDVKSQFTIGDDCGDESYESQTYTNREGKITKILGRNQVIFEQAISDGNKEKRRFTVELVGIDSTTNQKIIKQFLEKYILNQNVEITGNLKKESDKKFKGLVFVASDDDNIDWINENILENGIAKYKPFKSANLVSMVMPCRLQKAEERAKSTKVGIWAK